MSSEFGPTSTSAPSPPGKHAATLNDHDVERRSGRAVLFNLLPRLERKAQQTSMCIDEKRLSMGTSFFEFDTFEQVRYAQRHRSFPGLAIQQAGQHLHDILPRSDMCRQKQFGLQCDELVNERSEVFFGQTEKDRRA